MICQRIRSGVSRRRHAALLHDVQVSITHSCNAPWFSTRGDTPPPAFSETAQLMHSFINFQGQVLRLAQGDARLFNYVDNSIAYIAVGCDTVRREVPKRLILLGGRN